MCFIGEIQSWPLCTGRYGTMLHTFEPPQVFHHSPLQMFHHPPCLSWCYYYSNESAASTSHYDYRPTHTTINPPLDHTFAYWMHLDNCPRTFRQRCLGHHLPWYHKNTCTVQRARAQGTYFWRISSLSCSLSNRKLVPYGETRTSHTEKEDRPHLAREWGVYAFFIMYAFFIV
jgi:hypothetical protein